ncbi:MAG: hypothetical protein ACJ8ET_01210 [Sphingomicrobium sp.]
MTTQREARGDDDHHDDDGSRAPLHNGLIVAVRAIVRSLPVNFLAAASGLAGTIIISWVFGPVTFANYMINIAKMAVVLLGLEVLPTFFSVYRLQHDREFAAALPLFYLAFAAVAAGITAFLIVFGYLQDPSWSMLVYAALSVSQRYFDNTLQAEGKVAAFLWLPAISNSVRLLMLGLLAGLARQLGSGDILWLSLSVGLGVSQVYALARFPGALTAFGSSWRWSSVAYLWRLRNNYYPYYVNSVLRRVKEAALPLFVDAFMADKAAAGRFFLYFKAIEFSSAQVRTIEVFMVNSGLRATLQRQRVPLLAGAAALGQAATVVLSLMLLYRQGLSWQTVGTAGAISLFLIPYVIELYMRSNAYAALEPGKVSVSMVANLVATLVLLGLFRATSQLGVGALVATVVIGQGVSAATYFVRRTKPRTDRERLERELIIESRPSDA